MTNPFTNKEREIIIDAIQTAVDEIGPYGGPELDISALQDSYTWSECLKILSVLGNHPLSRGEWMERRDWYETYTKTMLLAIDQLRHYRIQKCHQKIDEEECSGYLIFFDTSTGPGKVAVTDLIPGKTLARMGISFTEDMLGYIIAICPTCYHIQIHDAPDR